MISNNQTAKQIFLILFINKTNLAPEILLRSPDKSLFNSLKYQFAINWTVFFKKMESCVKTNSEMT